MKFWALFILTILPFSASFSQETTLYIRANKEVFITGEDLWFHIFTLDSQAPQLSAPDRVVYLQLVRQRGDSVVWKEMYEASHGIAAGHVYLPASLEEGHYVLKAYSAHSFFSKQPYFLATAPILVVNDPRSIKQYRQAGATAIHPEQPAGKGLQVRFSEVKDVYAPKELVTVRIKTTDGDGKPVPAVLSLRVYDRFFDNPQNDRDVANYYALYTRVRDSLSAGADRKPVLSDSLQSFVLPVNKRTKQQGAMSLMLFNYNKSISQMAIADKDGRFYLTPDHLATGRRFFIKYFSEKEYRIEVPDPFDTIRQVEQAQRPATFTTTRKVVLPERNMIDTNGLQYANMLAEVVVKAKGRGYGDRYLGQLDSIARFEGNTDFVGQCGWLNCPACGSGKKPVEGVTYSELTDARKNQVSSHPFSFGAGDMRKVTYHYPTYTEADLLKRFKMIITNGFYQSRAFYQPDYAKDDTGVSDMRNSLYWSPVIVTDELGDAIVHFYCSDICSGFIGIAEGIGDNGHLGAGRFHFTVQ